MMLDEEPNDGEYERNKDVQRLLSIWRTELHAPEILPFQRDIVSTVKHLIDVQQEFIDTMLDQQDESLYFTITLYQSEIDRVRYSLLKYLRTRIKKIERQADHIKSDLVIKDRLSSAEKEFLTKLSNLSSDYLQVTVIDRMSQSAAEYFEQNTDRYKHAIPDLQEFVFCQALEDVVDLQLGGDRYQNFSRGDIAVLRYGTIRTEVLDGRMQLL